MCEAAESSNTRGLVKDGGEFRRTPKRGESKSGLPRMQVALPWLEGTMALFFAGATVAFAAGSTWAAIPIAILFLSGYGYVAMLRISERVRDSRYEG